jgi:hypothetical protein
MLSTGSPTVDAQRAFTRAARERRLATIRRLLSPRASARRGLPVYDERELPRSAGQHRRMICEIPIAEINGTVEPGSAMRFDDAFRPAAGTRCRWERLWLAEHRGAVLPPISVVKVGDGYAVRDGHHRVSVARARGAVCIDATIDATWAA